MSDEIWTMTPEEIDEAIDMAFRGNNRGGLEFKDDYCECDSGSFDEPGRICEYCAVNDGLRVAQGEIRRLRLRDQTMARELLEARAKLDRLERELEFATSTAKRVEG